MICGACRSHSFLFDELNPSPTCQKVLSPFSNYPSPECSLLVSYATVTLATFVLSPSGRMGPALWIPNFGVMQAAMRHAQHSTIQVVPPLCG